MEEVNVEKIIDRIQEHSRNFWKAHDETSPVFARIEGKSDMSVKTIYTIKQDDKGCSITISLDGNVIEPKYYMERVLLRLDDIKPMEALAVAECLIEFYES